MMVQKPEDRELFPAEENKVNHRIAVKQASMDNLDFPDQTFDVVWSEGAIYNIGFEKGLSDEELQRLVVGELNRITPPSSSLSLTRIGLKFLNGKLTGFVPYWEIR